MITRYIPVDQDYHEMIEQEQAKNATAVIHYFNNEYSLGEEKANITGFTTNNSNEEFVALDNGTEIRIDRIIVVNGKPGPAYDEYDSYANACLDCNVKTD